MEETKEAEMDDENEIQRVCKTIENQEDKNYEDMVSDCLVQLEYDIFQQIKAQLQKKTNALFLLCKQLVKAFIATYSPFTQLDSKSKLDKTMMRRKTLQMKSVIQDTSI